MDSMKIVVGLAVIGLLAGCGESPSVASSAVGTEVRIQVRKDWQSTGSSSGNFLDTVSGVLVSQDDRWLAVREGDSEPVVFVPREAVVSMYSWKSKGR